MNAAEPLSNRELRALRFIAEVHVHMDYWEDETIRLYRGLGLVTSLDGRIILTEAGKQALREAR